MIKKTKKFLFPTEEDDELYLEEEIQEEDESLYINQRQSSSFAPSYQQENLINETKEPIETKIFKPQGFIDAKEIMQQMLKAHSAIVDISDLLTSESGQREAEKIICYLCGVSDAVGYEVKKINISTFFFQSK